MPKGPDGEKRPADAVARADMVAQIATAEISYNEKSGRTRTGKAGADARATKLSKERRSELGKIAAQARWDYK